MGHHQPTNRPTDQPTNRPTDQPANRPTDQSPTVEFHPITEYITSECSPIWEFPNTMLSLILAPAPMRTFLPNVSIGKNVRIGAGARIRESIVLGNSQIGEHSLVIYSVIGWNSTVGDWSVGRLAGWSVGRLVGWSVGRLVGWWWPM